MKILRLIILTLSLAAAAAAQDLCSSVDPFIGTGGHGHTYPGASLPFGMVQLSPDTRLTGWDGCSGYHYSDSVIYGFSHTHLSGTGIPDYCDILFMPATGGVKLNNGYGEDPDLGYGSRFSHDREEAEPGYYRVHLDDYGIDAELTASRRAGLHRYRFPGSGYILLDLSHRDPVIDSEIRVVNDHEIEGSRRSNSWARNQHLYFAAQFSRPFNRADLAVDDSIRAGLKEVTGTDLKGVFYFKLTKGDEVLLKVGISAVSVEGARKNLEAEIPDWNFDTVRSRARQEWNKELGRITISGGTPEERTVFYTALYHALLVPNCYTDVDGRYRGTDLKVHRADDHTQYTVFSLWDTFRAEHPLFTLIEQQRTGDFIRSFLTHYRDGGKLPVWELAANYTGCMIGYHSVPVIVDAYMKGMRDFDEDLAFQAMMASADKDELGLAEYRAYGYIPGDLEPESVSKTLEYAYDDWCISQMARSLGREKEYRRFIERAQFYKNLYNKETGFMRARVNGRWQTPFDPAEVNFHYTEANSWQYSFFVPQDIRGLITLMGGEDSFLARLDSLFTADSRTSGREQADITGLIGQYAHGNEPSHHMAYLYNDAGQPWKTQELVRRIMSDLYTARPDGLAGNEDCGQMSAWYVMSAMGIYQVTPGDPVYALGSPLFDEITLHLENGNKFIIRTEGNGPDNKYIQSARLNGRTITRNYILHDEIMKGGELLLRMGREPNESWGSAPGDRRVTAITDYPILVTPFIAAGDRVFSGTEMVSLAGTETGAVIRYTLDGTDPGPDSPLYTKPFPVSKSLTLKAVALKEGRAPSYIMTADFKKIPSGRSVRILSHYSSQYTGGGDMALLDGIRGGNDFRTGLWQGYEGQDFRAVVDLESVQRIHTVGAGFLQDVRSWIWMPRGVRFSSSRDGKKFTFIGLADPGVKQSRYGVIIKDVLLNDLDIKARFIKIEAENLGPIPDWHPGAGGKAWIFIDEIIIE